MRKILIFSLVYYPRNIGGAEVAIKEITDRISNDDIGSYAEPIEFDMITLRKGAPAFEKIGNVNVYRVGWSWSGKSKRNSRIFLLSKFLYIPLAYLKALKLHRERKYDLIWSMMASYAGSATYLFKKNHPTIPLILTIQEGDNFQKRRGIFKPFFQMIFRSADKIQVISKFLADWSRSMGAACPIEIIPNGVDVELFSQKISDNEAVELKTKLGKKENDIFLITTSRLVEKNAVSDVIEALKYLPNNIKFLILGTGPDESRLKLQCTKLKLQERVIFLGFISHGEMPKYLQISDIFIRPSLTEGLGNSFLEAMAAGIPVIATPVGGIPDFLRDGETGLFCEVENPRSISQKVEKLIKDKESREYITRKAREMVMNEYQWKIIAEKMKVVFRSK